MCVCKPAIPLPRATETTLTTRTSCERLLADLLLQLCLVVGVCRSTTGKRFRRLSVDDLVGSRAPARGRYYLEVEQSGGSAIVYNCNNADLQANDFDDGGSDPIPIKMTTYTNTSYPYGKRRGLHNDYRALQHSLRMLQLSMLPDG